eukprot:TRINITY_DN1740_c0_g1_i7.p1 TRINITY_DN1740_c0_g1~~TRINITY_DN1740_c0_g1_i7.p1  ORF type:complete len:705 (-),score=226.61 TRINITY_DN1740_c0_g1_i7:106-2220(-)
MKTSASLALFASTAGAVHFEANSKHPVQDVVGLISSLAKQVEADGDKERRSYDKYACWCEDTTARKAADMSASKERIAELQELLKKLKGEIAVHGSEIEDLDAAIAKNMASQKEAADLRASRISEYVATKTESEQCIGALEGAIKVLTGAGAGKKSGFLMTMQEAQVLSAVAGIKEILTHPSFTRAASASDLEAVKQFVQRPETYLGASTPAVSALQVSNNPFGDYAPQSTQIQGILKGMYDAFVADLEKTNAEESEQEKSFQELMETKKMELATLQKTHEQHSLDKAMKKTHETESKQLLDDEVAKLEADDAFFAETKKACKDKATEWSERSRLRTEELQGMNKAMQILSSGSAKETFTNSSSSFLQTSSDSGESQAASMLRSRVIAHVREIAQRRSSRSLAQVAAVLRAGGHFDKVIMAIDEMMEVLRKEEQDDIAHRDRCQGDTNKNKNDMEDLGSNIEKLGKSIDRMVNEESELEGQISTLEGEINDTKASMTQLLDLRNDDVAAFRQSLKDDTNAVSLINQAIVALKKFYDQNGIALGLAQKQPEYSQDPDKAPETAWEGGGYKGRQSESTGIIAILSMLSEDLQMEMQTARKEDAAAQADYEKQRGAMRTALAKQQSSKTATETDLAELQARMQRTKEARGEANADLGDQKTMKDALATDCDWVQTHFQKRRDQRKAEMAGLTDAKAYLAGVESGDAV